MWRPIWWGRQWGFVLSDYELSWMKLNKIGMADAQLETSNLTRLFNLARCREIWLLAVNRIHVPDLRFGVEIRVRNWRLVSPDPVRIREKAMPIAPYGGGSSISCLDLNKAIPLQQHSLRVSLICAFYVLQWQILGLQEKGKCFWCLHVITCNRQHMFPTTGYCRCWSIGESCLSL